MQVRLAGMMPLITVIAATNVSMSAPKIFKVFLMAGQQSFVYLWDNGSINQRGE